MRDGRRLVGRKREREWETQADLERQISALHVTLSLISQDKLRKEFYLHWSYLKRSTVSILEQCECSTWIATQLTAFTVGVYGSDTSNNMQMWRNGFIFFLLLFSEGVRGHGQIQNRGRGAGRMISRVHAKKKIDKGTSYLRCFHEVVAQVLSKLLFIIWCSFC